METSGGVGNDNISPSLNLSTVWNHVFPTVDKLGKLLRSRYLRSTVASWQEEGGERKEQRLKFLPVVKISSKN